MEPSENSRRTGLSLIWKKRLYLLGVILVLGGLLSGGWLFRNGSGGSAPQDTPLKPASLEADLPRYEIAQRPFTVRFSVRTEQDIRGDLYLFLLSDLPLHASNPAIGVTSLKKGDRVQFAGHPSVELPCNGLKVKAVRRGDSWVAEPGLSLEEMGGHSLAYWFGTDGLWGNVQLMDGSVAEGFDAKRFLPSLKDFPFRLGKIEVISQQQESLLELVDKALGQNLGGAGDHLSSFFCRMGFGEEPYQLIKVQEEGKGSTLSAGFYLFGMEKGELKKVFLCKVKEKPEVPIRVIHSPALGKELIWIEESRVAGQKAKLFGWLNGKMVEVLNYHEAEKAPSPEGWTIDNLFVTKEGTLHLVRESPDTKGGKTYLLETYDWDFDRGLYSPRGKVLKASYAQYLLESGDYQDFLSHGFNRSNFESLLDYFMDVNNEGSNRNGIHNLLVTASGTDFGEDRDAWRNWFEEIGIKAHSNR